VKRLGIALVGCGWAGRFAYLVPLQSIAECRLVWVVDRDAELASATGREFGAACSGTQLAEALTDAEVDAVVVASPTPLHAEQTIGALQAGKHVLVEKPMASSAHEARAMAEAARTSGNVLMVAHCCRFMPAFVEAHRLIRDGQVGRPLHVQSRRNAVIEQLKPWWKTERPGGFLLSWLGSHAIDATLWLLGSGPTRVYAEFGRNTPALDGGDDAFSVLMWFEQQRTLASIDQSMASREREHDFLVIGSSGTLRVRDYVSLSVDGIPVDLSNAYEPGEAHSSHASYPRQLREFVGAIRERRSPSVSASDGLATMEVLDACYRAAATHSVQSLG
jgi:predicted dehydrogenase